MEKNIKIFKHFTWYSQTSSRNPHVDDESSDLEKSVGEESRILSVTTPRAQMAKKILKTSDNNSGVRRST
jgi:hypothetical protein